MCSFSEICSIWWKCKLKHWWILLHLFCCRFDVFTTHLVEGWWSTIHWSVVGCSRSPRCSCMGLLALYCKPQRWRIMFQPQKFSSHNSGVKSCKIDYESTQTRNESTHTMISQGWVGRWVDLSGPGAKRLKGKLTMSRHKGMSESTQLGIPSIELTSRLTYSDLREPGSKKEGAWVDATGEWVDSLKLPRIESTTCSDPGVLRRVSESTHRAKNLQKWVFPPI